jgi:purine-binding chemotaxis protein CheW
MSELPPETPLGDFENHWQMIRAQFETNDDERDGEVLRLRARQYAASLSETDQQAAGLNTDRRNFLIFMLDQERYGIEVSYVRAIRSLTSLTWLPGVPAFYRGVIHLKGKIISVLDLRYFFELDHRDTPALEYIVIENGPYEIALLASHVHGIESVAMSDVKVTENLRLAYGVNAEQTTLLNLSALFEEERLFVGESEE